MKFLPLQLKTFLLSLALLCGVGIHKAVASHYAAGDLQVTYIGGGIDKCAAKPEYLYEIVMTIYGACEQGSATIGSPQSINIKSINGGVDTNLSMDVIDHNTGKPTTNPSYNGEIVYQLCANFASSNSCINPANAEKFPGYRKWLFRDTILLPSAQTDWTFSYSSSARNSGITNLAAPGSFYFEAGLNNVAKFDVSTPRFTYFPLPYICQDVPFQYLNGPFDPDNSTAGQYLKTVSQVPLSGPGAPYSYNGGYSAADPISGTNRDYEVNPVSGTAKFTARNKGRFVLGFRLEKYAENDVRDPNDDRLIAYTMRDVQVSVLECTRPVPVFDKGGVPQNLKNATWKSFSKSDSAIYVCPGSKLSFDIGAYNDDPTKKNFIYWESNNAQSCKGSTFTKLTNGQDTIKASFSWTPTNSDIGDHTLSIIAKDSTCDTDLRITLPAPVVYIIRVIKGLDAGPDLPTCQFNAKGYRVLVKGTEYKLRVNWSVLNGGGAANIDSPNSVAPYLRASGTTDFMVRTPDLTGTCKVSDTVRLYVDTFNKITAFPGDVKNNFVLCRPDYLQLDATFSGAPPLTNHDCGINNPVIRNTKPDSVTLYGSFAFKEKVTYDTIGATSHTFSNLVRTSKQQFLYTRDELNRYGLVASTLTNVAVLIDSAKKPDQEYSNFTISLKCTDKSSLNKANGFETGMQPVYTAKTPITFKKGWREFKFDTPYNWDSTKNLIIEFCYGNNQDTELCNSNTLVYVPTSYLSALVYIPKKAAAFNTRIPDPDVLDACATTTNNDISDFFSRPLMKFRYYEVPPAEIKFKWTPGLFLSDSTIQAPLAYIPRSINYVIQSEGRNKCVVYDTVKIYVPEHDYKLTGDTTVCFGEQAVMSVNDGFDFKWYEYKDGKFLDAHNSVSCVQCKDVILTPKATTTYKVVVYDSVFCLDTVTATVTVLPLPDVHILTHDTVIKYGQSIQLLASGARMYNWMPVTGLSNANTSYPIATPLESTQYVLGAIGSNGCKAYDTVNVSIDNRDNLFIASAFSPNGDGKNDLFRIANLTFQRVLEFRVFNRWGQEVYNNNSNSGWDGTWKGVPQDMGNYSYQIRIGFPDGYVESYKGEVTLVR